MKKIKLSKLNLSFGGSNPPKDEKLIELLKKAYKGELLCQNALIKLKGIKTYSDYIPKISSAMVNHFKKRLSEGNLPLIYVYPEDGSFIMSDDYSTYHLYLLINKREIPCTVVGEAKGEYVVEKSDLFKLDPPSIEIIGENDES